MADISIQDHNGNTLMGILESKSTEPGSLLALMAHDVFEHKNSHFLPFLADKLPYSSFRFDFRGHGASTGDPDYANIQSNVEDLFTVARYFEEKGYTIIAVIGFGRGKSINGAVAALKYAATCQIPLQHCINISGWYTLKDTSLFPWTISDEGEVVCDAYQQNNVVQISVSRSDRDTCGTWDNSHVSRMPKSTCVLTCHGIDDTMVPPYHAARFANAISTHTLELVPGANHTFESKYEELAQIIVNYFQTHAKNSYIKAVAMGQNVSVCIPRWIDIEGVKNFRDIGGWPTRDGSGYIRERVVYRCGHLSNVTKKGMDTLNTLHVISAFDFRSDPEFSRDGIIPDIPHLTRYPCALYSNADFSPEALASRWKGYIEGPHGFSKVYEVILEKAGSSFRKIFLHMIKELHSTSRRSILVHCTAGKDRTGLFIMLLLGLCDVDDEIIINEFTLSNIGYWEPEKTIVDKAARLGLSVADVRKVTMAPYMAMKGAIDYVRSQYGSAGGYAREKCGLSANEIQALRDLMIVPIRFEERQLFRPTCDIKL